MTRRHPTPVLAACAALCLVLAAAARGDDAKPATLPADAAKADREALQGIWRLVASEVKGRKDEKPPESALKFDGDEAYELKGGEKKDPAVYRLDPSKDPRQIDLIPQSGELKGTTVQAIYEIKGDTLRLALGDADRRPKAFVPGEGVTVVLTFKREKPKG